MTDGDINTDPEATAAEIVKIARAQSVVINVVSLDTETTKFDDTPRHRFIRSLAESTGGMVFNKRGTVVLSGKPSER